MTSIMNNYNNSENKEDFNYEDNDVQYSNHYNEEDIYYFDFINAIIHIIPLDQIVPISNNIIDKKYATYTCNKFKIIKIELITYDLNDMDRFKPNFSHYKKNKSYDMFLKYTGPTEAYTFKSNESSIDKVHIFKSRERAFHNNMLNKLTPKIKYFWKGYNGIYREWNDDGTFNLEKSIAIDAVL